MLLWLPFCRIPAGHDARENAKRNHIENAEFFVGKAEEVLPEFYKKATTEASSDEMLHPGL